ncbi:MAG: hypothetical protein D6798_07965 [Deltaproteobacteria bacterium]|nr:MAG: hypothetical protein D6798_07965 [Deltaproteobacteria bacterium]
MVRLSSLSIAPLFLLAACGLGLEPLTPDELDAGPDSDLGDPVTVSLTGRTYAADIAGITVLEPEGLGPLMQETVKGTLLFHVTADRGDQVDLVLTLGDDQGRQDPCTKVYALPSADWTGNPALAIEDGTTRIDIAERPVDLSSLSMVALVRDDGQEWTNTHIRTLVDTRDLQGGSLPEGTDVCGLVAELGGECMVCDDGEPVCAVLELAMDMVEVDTGFDLDAGHC